MLGKYLDKKKVPGKTQPSGKTIRARKLGRQSIFPVICEASFIDLSMCLAAFLLEGISLRCLVVRPFQITQLDVIKALNKTKNANCTD